MDLLHDLSQTTFNSILLLVLHQSLLLVIAFEYIFARFSPPLYTKSVCDQKCNTHHIKVLLIYGVIF
jgi:hypothetical protein